MDEWNTYKANIISYIQNKIHMLLFCKDKTFNYYVIKKIPNSQETIFTLRNKQICEHYMIYLYHL